jgi:hypothetical protein
LDRLGVSEREHRAATAFRFVAGEMCGDHACFP